MIATTVEQSKHLIELGIPTESADMYYSPLNMDYPWVWVGKPLLEKGGVPAWSLSALLELIPSYLGEFNDNIDFGFSKSMNGKWYSAHYIKTSDNGEQEAIHVVTGNTPTEAAYKMVVWLKENNRGI